MGSQKLYTNFWLCGRLVLQIPALPKGSIVLPNTHNNPCNLFFIKCKELCSQMAPNFSQGQCIFWEHFTGLCPLCFILSIIILGTYWHLKYAWMNNLFLLLYFCFCQKTYPSNLLDKKHMVYNSVGSVTLLS